MPHRYMEQVYKGLSLESGRKEKALPVRFDLEREVGKMYGWLRKGSGEELDTGWGART